MDRGVIATASELFEARHYPGVVAMCTDALENEPECVPLLLIRARARVALRRDLDAQGDLRDVIRLDPWCGLAHRLLGELAARNDENEAAAQFFREALRLDPDDHEARDWLLIAEALVRPAAGAAKLPASVPAAGRFFSPARAERPSGPQRFARGTQLPDANDERPTKPMRRAPDQQRRDAPTPAARPVVRSVSVTPVPTMTGRPLPQPPAKPAPRLTTRTSIPDLPGFGDYLVASGILSRERLLAAQAYQRSMKVQLSTAIITLGLATPQRIEWAAVVYQSQLADERRLS